MKVSKILSLLAVLLLLFSFVGITAMAEGTGVAKIGDTYYTTFDNVLTAANGMTGDVTVEIYGEVEFTNGMELKNGSYNSITFVGKAEGAKITINQSAGGDYLEAHGKTVAFTDLNLAKANPAWSGNSGHMGYYFSVQGGTVTYTDCIFPNGACTNTGTGTYTNCTFENTSEYGLWVYDDAHVTVNGGTIDSKKGIKVYSEGEDSVTSTLTVQNATFTANVTAKPAVAIGYAESITLIGNTYNNTTGVLELDSGSDADCEGVKFVAQDANGNDIASTLTAVDRSNNKAPCGVLVDGKIYTTVTTAVAEATAGSTVTLLHNSTETVTLPEGVTLNKNGFTAENVTEKVSAVAYIGEQGYETVQAAIDAAQVGDTVTIKEGTYTVPTLKAGITVVGEGDVLLEGTLSGTLENLTMKNLYIKGGNAQRWAYAKGNCVFENVTFEATSVYALHFDGITEDATLLYKDCTIIGWAALGGSPASCVFDGCTIKGNGTYGVIRTYFATDIKNCTFDVANVNTNDAYQDGIHAVDAEVNVNNCQNLNGNMVDILNISKEAYIYVDDELVLAPELPNATVSKCNPLTLTAAEHKYMVWPSGDATIDRPLEIVMNFKANDTLEECLAGDFSDWLVDFNLKFTGLTKGTITADKCYLAGNYGAFGWIVIPTDGMVLEEGETYPVVSAYDATLNYKDICKSVKDFTAAIHVDQAILDENPNFTVELTLVMTNPDNKSQKLTVGEPAIYTAADLKNEEEETLDTKTSYVRNIVTTNANNETRYQVVLFAGIDSLKYSLVGFEITVQGTTREQSTKTVYESYTAAGVKYMPSAWGENCNYIFALPINFNPGLKDESVTYRPFAVTLDGKKIWGPEKTIDKIYNK